MRLKRLAPHAPVTFREPGGKAAGMHWSMYPALVSRFRPASVASASRCCPAQGGASRSARPPVATADASDGRGSVVATPLRLPPEQRQANAGRAPEERRR